MARYQRKLAADRGGGVPLTAVETKAEDPVRLTVFRYDEQSYTEETMLTPGDHIAPGPAPGVTWVNVDGVHDAGIIARIGQIYGLHPLLLESIQATGQRPKFEDYGDYLFLATKMFYLDAQQKKIITEHVSLVIGAGYVLSFQEMEGDVFGLVRERIRTAGSRLRKHGADYLLYSLLDAIVDNYFVILEKLGDEIEDLDGALVSDPGQDILFTIHNFKREMIYLRRSVWPLREVINGLERCESALFTPGTAVYYRELYERTIQVIDTVETFRDLFSGMLEIYLSSISNRLNEVMKVLTIISTIFIPLSFITGIYGMNFSIPELKSPWGYPVVLTVMACTAAAMVAYFRRRKWL